jgi:hypothetical protein
VTAPGRSCPLSYRYRPQDLAAPATLAAQTVFVVGCLYGNVAALTAVVARAAQEDPPAKVIFNGDFHFLDVDGDDFRAVGTVVAAHAATLGNVEAELLTESDEAGCGCGYPEYIDDATVDRSNAVVAALRETGRRDPALVQLLAGLPRHLTIDVGGTRVGVVHGDPESLAGWGLALEALEPGDAEVRRRVGWRGTPTTPAMVADWLRQAEVRVLACTHTGLPYAQDYDVDGRRHLVVNNGAAGLPNFSDRAEGMMTRLSAQTSPAPDSLYGMTLDNLRCDAVPLRYDTVAWGRQFEAAWPAGSPAHTSYAGRVRHGTHLEPSQSARGTVRLSHDQPTA